ncbi:MAG: hypothetical protein NTV98_03640 [Candidatus Roizmanbacteria bacterium]|nr:hypothetical protein [Candidatus Roizmanbacteria bacterium]
MKSLSYTRSTTLTASIQSLDELHKQLLLIPLSPTSELQLQWESEAQKIQRLLELAGKIVTPAQITTHLLHQDTKNPIPFVAEVESYQAAFDYLYHQWLVNPKVVELNDLVEFYQEVFPKETLTGDEAELKASLQYIQINPTRKCNSLA